MKIIKPYSYLNAYEIDDAKVLNIERAARVCYKSETKMENEVSKKFLQNILKNGHESVIEHEKATVYFVVDRGVSHEMVRHRMGSYSQESTRYCNYSADKFGNEITVIEPYYYLNSPSNYAIWENTCLDIEKNYLKLLETSSPQDARSILPNSLKTEIAVTYNFREWRHFFRLRCDKSAHPQMQQVAIPLLLEFKKRLAPIFDDVPYNENFSEDHYATVNVKKNTAQP